MSDCARCDKMQAKIIAFGMRVAGKSFDDCAKHLTARFGRKFEVSRRTYAGIGPDGEITETRHTILVMRDTKPPYKPQLIRHESEMFGL